MANYPQELAQDAVCQSNSGHMTGLWFLPARPLRLYTEYVYSTHNIEFKNSLHITQLQLVSAIKSNNDTEWNPMTLTSYIICNGIFKFL